MGSAADRQPPAPHAIPSLPPRWLRSKASGQLCLGGLTFCCLHLPPGQEEEEESEEWPWGGGWLDLMAKGQESAGRGCRGQGAKAAEPSPSPRFRPLASLFVQE